MNQALSRISNLAKFIILGTRKYKFLGIAYLIIFFFFLLFSPKLPPQENSSQNPLPTDDSIGTIANSAQAKVYKSGNQITVRWDKPVFDVSFRADSSTISQENFSCQLDFCTINFNKKAEILKVKWTENGQLFSQQFRF